MDGSQVIRVTRVFIEVGSNKFPIKDITLPFGQGFNEESGDPNSEVFNGGIAITLHNIKTAFFFNLMKDEIGTTDGAIIFTEGNDEKEVDRIDFKGATIVNYVKSWNSKEKVVKIQVVFYPSTIEDNGVTYKRNDYQ